jgi:acyl-CoA thioester hydrolase
MARTFRHRLRVRYGECDPQGVVFNANYLAYFDLVLTELWREAIGDYNDMVEAGADMVVAEATVRYRSSATFDDELDFTAGLARLGTTSMVTHFEAHLGARLVVEGELRHVFIDPATKSKRDIPAEIRAALEPYAEAQEAPA